MLDLVDVIIAFESGELSPGSEIKTFAELIRTGQAWQLQGFYGRTARDLIEGGFITRDGTITRKGQAILDQEGIGDPAALPE
jgi:hypothetical protein